ncbi:hypothetical protein N0V92_004342 [Colletotrichum tropicale]|nr:hypothetical protein N0V92_004342 [Colletotrichum tropicale]
MQTQQVPFIIGQCTSYSGEKGDCESGTFKISNLTINGWVGDGASSYVADMDCSKAAGGCDNITIEDVSLTNTTTGAAVTKYRCRDVTSVQGFTCT